MFFVPKKYFYPKEEIRGQNYKRLPKSLESFKRMYPALKRRSKAHELTREKAIQSVITILSLIPQESLAKSGEGTRFLLPLGSSLGVGEFIKGVIRIKAPKAKVTFLVPPGMTNFSGEKRPIIPMANLEQNLKKCVSQNDRHIIVVDDFLTGKTFRAIQETLNKIKSNNSSLSFSINYHDYKNTLLSTLNTVTLCSRFSPVEIKFAKEHFGTFAAPPSDYYNWLKYKRITFWRKLIKSVPRKYVKQLVETTPNNSSKYSQLIRKIEEYLYKGKKIIEREKANSKIYVGQDFFRYNPEFGRDHEPTYELFKFMSDALGYNGVKDFKTIPKYGLDKFNFEEYQNKKRAILLYAFQQFPTEKKFREMMTIANRKRKPKRTINQEQLSTIQANMKEVHQNRKEIAFYRRQLYNLGVATAIETIK